MSKATEVDNDLRAAAAKLVEAVENLPGWLPLAPVIALRCERVRNALEADETEKVEERDWEAHREEHGVNHADGVNHTDGHSMP